MPTLAMRMTFYFHWFLAFLLYSAHAVEDTSHGLRRSLSKDAVIEDPPATVTTHRVWVDFNKDATRENSLQTLQTHLMTTIGTTESEAMSLLTNENPEDLTAGMDDSLFPFRMHYDFFEHGLKSIVMTVDAKMLEALGSDPSVRHVTEDFKRYPMVQETEA